MVVDPQGNALLIGGKGLRKHSGCGHVHAEDTVIFLCRRNGQPLMEPGKPGGDLRIFHNVGSFPQAAQDPAQGGGAAQGVSVRIAVGQNGIVVMGPEKIRSLIPGDRLHRG